MRSSSNRRSFDNAQILASNLSHFDISISYFHYIWCHRWCQAFLEETHLTALRQVAEGAGAKKLLLLGCGTALGLAAVLYGVVFGFTDSLVALFNSENSALMAEFAHSGMRIYFAGYFFAGCNIVAAGYLGAVDRPTEASITSLCRGMAAIVVCSLVLSALFGMAGVWAAFPASEAITFALTLYLLKRGERTAKA